MVWAGALPLLQRSVQVVEAVPDKRGSRDGTIAQGTVAFAVTDYRAGKPGSTVRARATQSEFETFLRTGAMP